MFLACCVKEEFLSSLAKKPRMETMWLIPHDTNPTSQKLIWANLKRLREVIVQPRLNQGATEYKLTCLSF